ncbi:MAG: hypothetical protein AAF552_12780 [Pseudomonadota bacterium]
MNQRRSCGWIALGSFCLSIFAVTPTIGWAQGQDSQPYERDLMVIATMLRGGFDNANQSYFDVRGDRDEKHRRIHQVVESVRDSALGEHVFVVSGYWDSDPEKATGSQLWSLRPEPETATVQMQMWALEPGMGVGNLPPADQLPAADACELLWRREPAQFRATSRQSCAKDLPTEVVISERQLWMAFTESGQDFQLHRIRRFECYADIPGVGGGRNEPYDRYDGLQLHDQGGQAWFTDKDGRRFRVSLFLVDWPINNYEGIFTRDSLVVYLSEDMGDSMKEHGYAFTVPNADRIGLNLKWALVSCYMNSNRFETPFM